MTVPVSRINSVLPSVLHAPGAIITTGAAANTQIQQQLTGTPGCVLYEQIAINALRPRYNSARRVVNSQIGMRHTAALLPDDR